MVEPQILQSPWSLERVEQHKFTQFNILYTYHRYNAITFLIDFIDKFAEERTESG